MGHDSRLTIKAALSTRYTKVGITVVDDFAGLKQLVAKKPDLVILGMKFILLNASKGFDDSQKIWLPDYLEEHGIAVTGSDSKALSLEYDKHAAKQTVINAGLESPKYFVSRIVAPDIQHSLHFPLFVKPSNRGDSKGVDDKSLIYSEQDLVSKIASIHADLNSDALIEEYLPGKEFSVGIVRQPYSDKLLALPVEIVIPINKQGDRFLSEAIKQADTEEVVAVDDPELRERLNLLAIGVFNALGSRDYGRIDMRLDLSGDPSFIEANLMPGLSNHGYLYKCFDLNGRIAYSDMITLITELGLERASWSENASRQKPYSPQCFEGRLGRFCTDAQLSGVPGPGVRSPEVPLDIGQVEVAGLVHAQPDLTSAINRAAV